MTMRPEMLPPVSWISSQGTRGTVERATAGAVASRSKFGLNAFSSFSPQAQPARGRLAQAKQSLGAGKGFGCSSGSAAAG
jgi:hypothetical protein